jgi:mRNA interferase HigB
MRIIKESTLTRLCGQARYKRAEQAIRSWIYEVRFSDWNNAGELKAKYKNASVISSKRVIFNICRNNYRLIADIEYQLKIIFVVWFGTHNEYNSIDVNEVSYDDKSNKK